MEYEKSGQFVSVNCECHLQEPYGFVPECDCPEHDNEMFLDFIRFVERRAKKAEHEQCGLGCPRFDSGHSINADGMCNMGCC